MATRRPVIEVLRPGWSVRRQRFTQVGVFARLAVLAFVLHASGVAHFLCDVLFEDDMTCVDELAQQSRHGLTSPTCPTCQALGQAQTFTPPATRAVSVPPSMPNEFDEGREAVGGPASAPTRSIDRPPRT